MAQPDPGHHRPAAADGIRLHLRAAQGRFAVGGPRQATTYATLLAAGVAGLAAFYQGFQAVTIRFSIEFGYTKESEDRVLAPLPLWALGIEKILTGALQAALAGIMVFPISAIVPAAPVHFDIRWPLLAAAGLLAALLSAAFGTAAGTLIDLGKIQIAATALILPVTFFGAVHLVLPLGHPVRHPLAQIPRPGQPARLHQRSTPRGTHQRHPPHEHVAVLHRHGRLHHRPHRPGNQRPLPPGTGMTRRQPSPEPRRDAPGQAVVSYRSR